MIKKDTFFLTYPETKEWLITHTEGQCEIITTLNSGPSTHWISQFNFLSIHLKHFWHFIKYLQYLIIKDKAVKLAHSEGIIEKYNIDLIHFPIQSAFITRIPSIYHPHDLQHLHHPKFFNKWQITNREINYRKFCNQATIIAVASSWIKNDIIKHYSIDSEKVKVIPLAQSNEFCSFPSNNDLLLTKRKFNLPDEFIFYPAQTWEHKNHIGLIESVAYLRDNFNLIIPVVFSGHMNEFYPKILNVIRKNNMFDQIKFVGFVSLSELQSLYELCKFVIIPTKYEAASFPLIEAFYSGTPVACSNVTSLPEQAGNAALIFDPYNIIDISEAIKKLWYDKKLRKNLVEYGKKRIKLFSWGKTCRHFRAYYRLILKRNLSPEDMDLIDNNPFY
ncbi:glycosyltransferase family 4 protein [Desulfosarcina cetonica]|uniref:glycosyltransferase family 4 protein n=1 Tax=Desulfosarcina cetonica TaxID=90730 RepID=UPI0009FA2994|nr:glycosyltransferase family 1 protein [Desulfosarcina cetonica]